jgi:hypothetical protein
LPRRIGRIVFPLCRRSRARVVLSSLPFKIQKRPCPSLQPFSNSKPRVAPSSNPRPMENPPALPSPEPETEVSQAPPRRLLRLRCAVQHYEWGQRGAASLVARLADHNPDPARPYAELWMGTHPSGPSSLVDDGSLLRDWLARNHDALGPAVAARWGGDLPFLFKVLQLADERFRGLDRCIFRLPFAVSNAG